MEFLQQMRSGKREGSEKQSSDCDEGVHSQISAGSAENAGEWF